MYVFFVERNFFMMFLLVFNVLNRFINNRLAYRKYSITALPSEVFVLRRQCFYPSTTVTFYLFNKVRHIFASRQHANQMDVVGCTSYADGLTSCGIHQLANVRMNLFQVFFVYPWTGSLYVKNHMKVYLAKRLCHYVYCFCPFRALPIVLL